MTIHNYRGDNGVYKAAKFVKDLNNRGQTIKYSGVGAHHQNGVAERAIRTISESARVMLLHAAIHWPEETMLDLWPTSENTFMPFHQEVCCFFSYLCPFFHISRSLTS